MKTENRHKAYKFALEEIQSSYDQGDYSDCLCDLITTALVEYSIDGLNPHECLDQYPEIWKHLPKKLYDPYINLWFPFTKPSCARRIKILQQAVHDSKPII